MNRRDSRATGQNIETASGADANAPDALCALAGRHLDAGRTLDAQLACQQALAADPGCAEAMHLMGVLFARAGQGDHAIEWLSRAARQEPAPRYLIGLGQALGSLGRFGEAVAAFAQAHPLAPDNADLCNDMGVFLRMLGRYEEALTWFDKALALRPNVKTAHSKAYTLERLHRFDEARAIYTAIKAADSGNAEADLNLALLDLLAGDFERGLAGREARWQSSGVSIARSYQFSQPMWRGERPLAGKTLLVYQDEGLGDVLQFARYVPMLAAEGARVILHVDAALIALLSRLPGVIACLPRSATQSPPFDLHCAITSLPLAFATRLETIPSAVPYLPAPEPSRRQAWERRLGPHDRMRVGLAWSGNPRHPDNHNRLVPLAMMASLLDLDATFVSLQKDMTLEDRVAFSGLRGLVDLTAHLSDLAETAALMSCLDLVITVDTSMAHLAGALACPTWILLQYTPDWRWLLGRDDSPWYPTARLFRQSERRDYAEVIARVRAGLQAKIASRSPHAAAPAPLSVPALMFNAALAEMRAGQPAEARRSCEQGLALDPHHADTLHLMGVLALNDGAVDAALEWISRAIRSDPRPIYLVSLGTLLLRQKRFADAVAVFEKAVQLKPDDAGLWRHLGNALVEAARPADAIPCLQQVLKLDPGDLDATRSLSLLLSQVARYEEALVYFDRSEALSPGHFPTLYMRAQALQNLGRLEAALADNLRAHALEPGNADTCYNIGNVLRLLDRHGEAIGWYDKALALRPRHAETLGNKAVMLAELRRFDEAIATYREAIAADPAHAVAAWNLALLQLLLGDFDAGWRGQEARWKVPAMASRALKFTQPKWLGAEPVAGRTVLVWANEGLGDVIQFVRYVPQLATRGANVILAVPHPLCGLLSRVKGVAQCLPTSSPAWPESDFHVPLSSLPLAFGTRLDSIPAEPYLPAPAAERIAAWDARLGRHDRMRIGLVWSGNVNHNNDRNRSMPLRLLTPLLALDARFVSLQKDPRPDDAVVLREQPGILDLTAGLADFTDTAALIASLDLVIAVDTSVAHLAGALGCPTWILLPYTPDWRWLLGRDDSPWYPAARLFRQDERRDYCRVMARVRDALAAQIAAFTAGQNRVPAP